MAISPILFYGSPNAHDGVAAEERRQELIAVAAAT
jgi:hypothetical protein